MDLKRRKEVRDLLKATSRPYRNKLKAYDEAASNNKFLKMATLQQEIIAMEDNKYLYLEKKSYEQRVSIDTILDKFTEDERWQVTYKTNAIMMLCDFIEIYSMDIEQVVDKYFDGRIKLYDKLIQIGKEAKLIREMIVDTSSEEYQYEFAEDTDELYVYVDTMFKSKFTKRIKERENGTEEEE